MSLEYYIRNLDRLSGSNYASTPRNAVLDVSFSEEQLSVDNPGNIETLTYTATGGETSFQDDDLINATIISLSRDGLIYTPKSSFSADAGKEYHHDGNTGEITFHPGLPAMNPPPPNEDVVISYISADTNAIVSEPVTLTQAKAWLRVTHDDEDTLITALITAARQKCEAYCGKGFVSRTVTAIVRNDLGNVRLPYGPVTTVTNVYDYDGNELTGSDYNITGVADKRLGYPMLGYVKVVYTAGYASLPQQFKTAILMQLAWMYTHRGDEDINLIAPDTKAILSPYRSHV